MVITKHSIIFIFIILLVNTINIAFGLNNKVNDIFGISAGGVELINMVSEEEFKRKLSVPFSAGKGAVVQVDKNTMLNIYEKYKEGNIVPSGAVSNIVINYLDFGGKASLNTVISSDELGLLFYNNMLAHGIVSINPPQKLNTLTSVDAIFITPDHRKTVITNSNVANFLSQQNIKYYTIKDYKLVLIEAAIFGSQNKRTQKAAIRALNTAKKIGVLFGVSLSHLHYVGDNKSNVLKFLPDMDILIGSEQELKDLFEEKELAAVVKKVQPLVPLSIITQGIKGAIIITKDGVLHADIVQPDDNKDNSVMYVSDCEETFLAGFFFKYLNGSNVQSSTKFASEAASSFLKTRGSSPKNKLSKL